MSVENNNPQTESDLNRIVLDSLPDAVFLISEKGLFRDVYGRVDSALGERIRTFKGKHIQEIWSIEKATTFLNTISDVISTRRPQMLEYWMSAGDDEYFFEGRVSPIEDDSLGGNFVTWVAYEITARKRLETALQQRDSLMEGVAKAKTTLLTVPDMAEAISRSLASIGRAAKVDRVYIFQCQNNVDTGIDLFSKRYEWMSRDAPPEVNRNLVGLPLEDEFPVWYERLEQNGVVRAIVNHLPKRSRVLLKKQKVKSLLLLPIWVELKFWGFIGFDDCNRERNWEYIEVATLRVAAGSIGAYIHNKQGEEQLKQAKETADAANAAKSEFLAMMSHEIRTPMNAILGFADLLTKSQMDEQQQEYVRIINQSGKTLLELINNILDYSKIESQGVELELEKFNLEMLIIQSMEIMLVKAREKGITLELKINQDDAKNYIGDANRIRQILINLVNNAVKFTHEGGVTVTVEVGSVDRNRNCMVEFRVVDTGIGISPDKIQQLFKPFSQVSDTPSRSYGGTGLGLVISKRLVNRMGGEIWAESEEGRGSSFIFNIRLQSDVEKSRPDPVQEEGEDSGLDENYSKQYPLEILLAEDDQINQRVMTQMLKYMGYEVDVANNGEEAKEKVLQKKYDVVLLDIQMPVLDGLQFTKLVRTGDAGDENLNLYIIAASASVMKEDKTRYAEVGINDYVMKPIEIGLLKEALARAHQAVNG